MALVSPLRSSALAAAPPRPAAAWASRIAPGLALSLLVSLAALGLQGVEQQLFGRAWLESLVLAILLGASLRTLLPLPAQACAGVAFSAKTVLEIAVVLLGASISAATLVAAGPGLLFGIMAIVALAISASFLVGRLFGLPWRMAVLVACGNSICGNSAIAAVAPVIDADGDDVGAAIAFTAVLGVAVVLGLPLLGFALHMSGLQYGALAGLTVYAVPQVLAAAAPMGAAAVQTGTLVKLMRVLMLGPVCFALAMIAGRKSEGPAKGGFELSRFVPWFILGFLGLMAVRSAGLIPSEALGPIKATADVLTVVSMAALGLSTDLKSVAGAGARVTLTVCASLVALGAMSLGLIHLLQLH